MKKSLVLLALMAGFSQTGNAATIDMTKLTGGQSAFRSLSEDFGAALSYKPITPPTSLGLTGFDLGIEATYTELSKSKDVLKTLTGTSIPGLIVPKLHVYKGLPFNIDIGGFYSAVPTTNIQMFGGEIRYGILPGSMTMPAVGVRGAMTKLSGVSHFTFDTKSVDISVSKGFAMLTPYAGVGQVWVNSSTDAIPGIAKVSLTQSKLFAGANLNLGMSNLAFEWDKTGSANTYGIKLGFRW